MANFEDIGRKLDAEVQRLREVLENELGPKTRLKTAKSLRSAAEKLSRLAADLESKVAPKAE